ncbi:MAG: MFS transporter [Deltaproteobacteria bacterium]
MNRWLVAAGGVALMACLGTVYAWSVYTQPLQAAFGWTSAQATAPFSIAIFFLGVGAVLGGRWQDRAGPRPVALTGALLWGLGNLLAGLGTARFGVAWLCLAYGVVGGLGLGLGYVTPVAAVTKWFPDRRGLGSGLVVGGFGLGAFGYAHVLKAFPAFSGGASGVSGPDVLRAFTVSGVAFAVLGGAGALLVRNPPSTGPVAAATGGRDFSPGEMVRTPQFWAAFAMLFLNVTAGILFISNAVPIMRELTGAAPAAAAAVYGTIALANALGRFLWGAVSDRAGRRAAFAAIYLLQVAVFLVVGRFHSLWMVAPLFALVLLCYGGGFGVMPSLVADWFGTRHLGVNYGWVLLAWSLAGVAGPAFVALVKDRTGSYAGALPVTAAVLAVAVLLPVVARAPGVRPVRRPGSAPGA